MAQARKRITRGKFVRLPGGAGSVAITRTGEVVYKKAAPKKKRKNPAARTAAKAKRPARRVLRAMATWVRRQNSGSAKRRANGCSRRAAKKGGKR